MYNLDYTIPDYKPCIYNNIYMVYMCGDVVYTCTYIYVCVET